jgi:hypothetical protein
MFFKLDFTGTEVRSASIKFSGEQYDNILQW